MDICVSCGASCKCGICDECLRGKKPVQEDVLNKLKQALASRMQEELELKEEDEATWLKTINGSKVDE